jgi:hypothetical protein
VRRPIERHKAVLQEHRAIAEALDRRCVMRDEDDRAAALLELEDLPEALALERLVADGEHLVEQQHVGLDVRGDREAEAHVHPREYVRTGRSMKSSSPANATISSSFSRIVARRRPWIEPLR